MVSGRLVEMHDAWQPPRTRSSSQTNTSSIRPGLGESVQVPLVYKREYSGANSRNLRNSTAERKAEYDQVYEKSLMPEKMKTPTNDDALEKGLPNETTPGSRFKMSRKRLLLLALLVVCIIAVAVTVPVVLNARKTSTDSGSSVSSGGVSGATSSATSTSGGSSGYSTPETGSCEAAETNPGCSQDPLSGFNPGSPDSIYGNGPSIVPEDGATEY